MGKLRVIAGKARGRRLRTVPGDATRPVTDRVKEALFNILGGDIHEASFLDLFAGTGSVGIEALSRGATFACFIDAHRLAVQTIRSNLAHTGLQEGAQVLKVDAFKYLTGPADRQHPDWLASDAWVIVQIHPVEYQEIQLDHLIEFDQRRYGSTLLVFYERREETSG